jgi:hypothetical protein
MDLKELYLRQRISAEAAAAATSPEARLSHRKLAAGYANRIVNYDAQDEERYSSASAMRFDVAGDGVIPLRAPSGAQPDKSGK